ncbi:VOC family protein [Solimonas terrae]|uniref:VOC family protein n=1 Tax=Solimonas terrae TaxID=1396819 RepID=A0A6M2BPG6_9GAMM|nr:VOC family protein [Solimonas terrae]NGY04200.1 VOC family protein [Solimonas terrae]
MYDHVGLRIGNLAASGRFYRAVLAPLGYVADASGGGFGPDGRPMLWLHEHADAGVRGVHLAFAAASRAAVDAFHHAGVAAGGRDNGAPGLRSDYGPNYYAAFLLDPDGNNVEAVCLKPGN